MYKRNGLFENRAGVEKTRGERFGGTADRLQQGRLFAGDTKVGWMCLIWGYVGEATAAPAHCPVCRHPQGYFVRVELAPYHSGPVK